MVCAYSLTLGTVGPVASALFMGEVYLVFGMGGMERLAVFPLQAWAALVGVRSLRASAKGNPDRRGVTPGSEPRDP